MGKIRGIWEKFKSYSLKKKIFIVIGIIIFILIAFSIFSAVTKKPGFETTQVKKGDIIEIVNESGTITAAGKIDVYSPTNGVVTEVLVANGQTVEDKQELFKVESSATEAEVQAAYSNYLTAAASLNAAKSNLNVLKSSMLSAWDSYYNLATGDTYENADGSPKAEQRNLPEFNIAQNDWYAAEAKYKDQQTVVGQAAAQTASAKLAYDATQNSIVKAPTTGVVSNLAVSVGTSVAINSLASPARPVLTIAKPGTVEVTVALSEEDITKVKEGQKAKVDAGPSNNPDFSGIVKRVDSIGTNDVGVIRYNAYVEIINPNDSLLSGMNADVEIITREIKDVLVVPNSSVKPYQGGRAVRVYDNTKREIVYIPVEVGIRGEENTQILKGIKIGQVIITKLSNEQIKRPGLFGS